MMIRKTHLCLLAAAVLTAGALHARADGGYAVVVSQTTLNDPQWKPVVDGLVAKHQGQVIAHPQSVAESLPALREAFPRYACFVARPSEASREFIAQVHRLMRCWDDDPYTDALWGILTGYDAAGALRIANQADPLTIRRVAAATDVELSRCEEGVWYCELVKNRMVRKRAGQPPQQEQGPDDTTRLLVDALNDYQAQLFVTSGHATERDWQIGFRYRNGQFRCQDGQLFGLDTKGQRFPIQSAAPKVYLPVGNCLMGHIDSQNAMALAFLQSAGVCQMIGYTVPTWYGYAGWGLLDYFVEQPGRFTLAESFFANEQALLHRLETYFPEAAQAACKGDQRPGTAVPVSAQARAAGLTAQDAAGLAFDADVVAFYGDPAWVARLAPGLVNWEQTLSERDGTYTFNIKPRLGAKSFDPVNTNGSQRGGRPIFQLLPQRVRADSVRLVSGSVLSPLITDNFLLVPHPGPCDPERTYRVVFHAEKAAGAGAARADLAPTLPMENGGGLGSGVQNSIWAEKPSTTRREPPSARIEL